MDTLSYKTISGNAQTANKKWFIVDAEGHTVGRLASKVAKVIQCFPSTVRLHFINHGHFLD